MQRRMNAAPLAAKGAAMARARNIKPGFFVNDDLCELPALTRLLFIGLWCVADRAGRLLDRPKRIKLEVLPGDDCDIDAMLWELHSRNFIVRYEFGGQSFIEVCNWAKHQRPHHTEKSSEFVSASYDRATVKAAPDKASPDNREITVKQPTLVSRTPSDTGYLIPDTGYLIPEEKHMSTKPEKTGELSGEVSKVFEHWQTAMNKPRAKLDDKRRALIRKALSNGYSAADICKAIDGCRASAWHMGQNERGTAFNGLELILRNAEKIDGFMSMRDNPPDANRTLTREEARANVFAQLTGRARLDQGGGDDAYTIDG